MTALRLIFSWQLLSNISCIHNEFKLAVWMDNVFIERLWRSLKYECIYLNAFDTVKDAERGINHWMNYYNHERPHSSLEDKTPAEVYKELAA